MKAFKSYDIRGLYPEEINEKLAYKIGRAFVTFLNAKKIAVGYDMRSSSPSLFKALTKGMIEQGAQIISIGLSTTPMLSYTVAHQNLDGGIMISASHNPSQYNAFKLIGKHALQLSEETGINQIKQLVINNKFTEKLPGNIINYNILPDYINHVHSHCKDINNLKIVIDHGNGVGAISSIPLLNKLNIKAIHLYPEPDGNFPNHPANPHDIENLKDLQNEVIQNNADLGIFFDGDADRSIIVDENGEVILSDLFLTLLAQEELQHQSGKIYYDLRFSNITQEIIQKNNGTPFMMRVGNPFYKEKLINEGGLLAGELSGHIMFKENYNIDDGLFATIKLMNILCKHNKPLSELIQPFKKYYSTPEINLKVTDADYTLNFIKSKFNDGEHIELDGVYVKYPEWWFNLRKSNTEPLVRLRLEANNNELLEEKKQEMLQHIKNSQKL